MGQGRTSAGAGRTAERRRRELLRPDARWPWAAGAAAGALAGAAVAVALRRRRGGDPVLEPEDLQAVVDRPDGTTTGT